MISEKILRPVIASLIFIAAPTVVQAAESPPVSGSEPLLVGLLLFYLPWVVSASGRGGRAWKFLCFAFCTISLAFVALTIVSIITIPLAFPVMIAGSVTNWIIAWVFTAVARSAVSRHAHDEAVLAELRKQNQFREEEASGGRKCPFCAELVKRDAILCKHCGRDLPPLDQAEPAGVQGKSIPKRKSTRDRMREEFDTWKQLVRSDTYRFGRRSHDHPKTSPDQRVVLGCEQERKRADSSTSVEAQAAQQEQSFGPTTALSVASDAIGTTPDQPPTVLAIKPAAPLGKSDAARVGPHQRFQSFVIFSILAVIGLYILVLIVVSSMSKSHNAQSSAPATVQNKTIAQYFPEYSVDTHCWRISRLGGLPYADCVQQQQSAADDLRRRWSALPVSVREYCLNVASAGGGSSYVALKGCVTDRLH